MLFVVSECLFLWFSVVLFVFFFSSRRRHTRLVSDWSSDVCSSDLLQAEDLGRAHRHRRRDLIKRCGALTVQFHVAAEVLGARREAVGQKMNEVLAGACLKRVIGAAFFPDGR